MSDLVAFASALAAKASPGPSGRVFRAWPWGMDADNPDVLMTLVSSAGHVLAQDSVSARLWNMNGEAGRVWLVTACMTRLVAKAIHPTQGRYKTGLRAA